MKKKLNNFKVKKKLIKNKRLIGIFTGSMIALSLGFVSTNDRGYVLSINNQPVTYGMSTELLTTGFETVEKDINEKLELSQVYIANEFKINTKILKPENKNLEQEKIVEDISSEPLDLRVKGVDLKLDGEHKEYFETEADARDEINEILNKRADVKEGQTLKSIKINNKVEINPSDFLVQELSFKKESKIAVASMKKKTEKESGLIPAVGNEEKVLGEVLGTASHFKTLTLEDIKETEPIIEGVEIESVLDAVIEKEGTEKESIPFETLILEDDTVYYDQGPRVTQQGVNGEILKQVTYTIANTGTTVTVNHQETIKEPVSQTISIGTKSYPVEPEEVVQEKIEENYRVAETLKKINPNPQGVLPLGPGIVLPSTGVVTSIDKPGSHEGGKALDIANDTGTLIVAPIKGMVTLSGENGGYGNSIEIKNPETGYETRLGHMSELIALEGQEVGIGDVVGLMGSTGNSTGPHVHFELFHDGEKQAINDYFDVNMDDRVEALTGSKVNYEVVGSYGIISEEEKDLFYRCVASEAGGEPYEGMVAVASAIIYTAEEKGISLSEVITAPNQFSVVSDGSINRVVPSETVIKATEDALSGLRVLDPETKYFYAPGIVESSWHESLVYTGTIGNHRFFKQPN